MTKELKYGRRASDKWVELLIKEVIGNVKERGLTKKRRPRRTKKQLAKAYRQAALIVTQQHPEWTHKRMIRRAKNLVRLYKVA